METSKALNYLLQFLVLISLTSCQVPVVLWHGMGDSCCNPLSMGYIMNTIEKEIPGVYVKSIRIGNNVVEDIFNSYFKKVDTQIEQVCNELSIDPNLKNGFHAVGFSQGAQFLRALIQRCSKVRIMNYVSLAGQHQGVFGLPKCPPTSIHLCEYMREMLSKGAYESHIQNHIVQAQYWHDPLQEDVYRHKSIFLADINQELTFNSTYRENLIRLENLVLVMFNNETIVIPKESEWFGYYKSGQSEELFTLQESDIYIKDQLGLKALDEKGRLKLVSVDGDHLGFTITWFIKNIINKYLK